MGSLSEASYDIKEANTEMAKGGDFSMEMAGVSVEDYEEAGLVILADELGGVGLKENQLQGIIVNKGGDAGEQAPEMAAAVDGDGGEENGEMEVEEKWPGAWEFERDGDYYQWIWYCPDVFVLDYQLPNYNKFL